MDYIFMDGGIKPVGHYSPAVKVGDFVFLSGQLPIDPYTGEKYMGNIDEQIRQIFKNLDDLLRSADSGKNDIVKMTVYIKDISLWPQANEIYSKYFGNHKPARTIVPVSDLHYGFSVEMDAISYVGK